MDDGTITGRMAEAVHHYSTALSHIPDNAIVLSNRALAYIKLENYGLAMQDAGRAVEADPSYPKGYYRRGSAEFALGRAKAARKDFRQVVRLRPRDRDARAKLAACDKAVKAAAFAAAILSDEQQPLSDTFRPESIQVEGGYDGHHPAGGGGAAPRPDGGGQALRAGGPAQGIRAQGRPTLPGSGDHTQALRGQVVAGRQKALRIGAVVAPDTHTISMSGGFGMG